MRPNSQNLTTKAILSLPPSSPHLQTDRPCPPPTSPSHSQTPPYTIISSPHTQSISPPHLPFSHIHLPAPNTIHLPTHLPSPPFPTPPTNTTHNHKPSQTTLRCGFKALVRRLGVHESEWDRGFGGSKGGGFGVVGLGFTLGREGKGKGELGREVDGRGLCWGGWSSVGSCAGVRGLGLSSWLSRCPGLAVGWYLEVNGGLPLFSEL